MECAALGVANQRFVIPVGFHNGGNEFEGGRGLGLCPTERTEQVVVDDDLIEIGWGCGSWRLVRHFRGGMEAEKD